MVTMTATEAKNKFGELGEQVQSGPITVTKSGRETMVIVSAEEYARLVEIEDRVWGERALQAMREQTPVGVEATTEWVNSLIGRGD